MSKNSHARKKNAKKPKNLDLAASIARFTAARRALTVVGQNENMATEIRYVMGTELKLIHVCRLHQETKIEGKPKYNSFEQFLDLELKFSKTYAYRLIEFVDARDLVTRHVERAIANPPSALSVAFSASWRTGSEREATAARRHASGIGG